MLGGDRVGLPELAEDLALADHHRVQPGRHPVGVVHRVAAVVRVHPLGEVADRTPARSASTVPMSESPPWNEATTA